MNKVQVPPIKCQGIKTKLVPFIQKHINWDGKGVWIEPFLGSGVVGFNVNPKQAIFADTNPHIINFYQKVNEGEITPPVVKQYLVDEGRKLSENGQDHYYEVRARFNEQHNPLDFLFLSRAGFNGVIRFNSKGGFNVPFNHKTERFSKAYITKVVNQVRAVFTLSRLNNWKFLCQHFSSTLSMAREGDFIYSDPPYAGRHVDYFNSWDDDDELKLFELLSNAQSKFMLSTWHSNQHRTNSYIDQLWSKFTIVNRSHFYHVGAKEANRKPMLEALVMNYQSPIEEEVLAEYHQPRLVEKTVDYTAT